MFSISDQGSAQQIDFPPPVPRKILPLALISSRVGTLSNQPWHIFFVFYFRLQKKMRGMVVLNVDDDIDNLEMFCEAVREVNPAINCIKAFSGKEALELLNQADQLPDYIFLDMNMPSMNGKACLKKIRHDEKLSDIRVFMLSSSCNRKEIEECRSLGAHFLRKEISHRRLVEVLKKVIREN